MFMTDVIEGYFHHNLDIYVNRSIELARQRHPAFTEEELVIAAADEFNAASQITLRRTAAGVPVTPASTTYAWQPLGQRSGSQSLGLSHGS